MILTYEDFLRESHYDHKVTFAKGSLANTVEVYVTPPSREAISDVDTYVKKMGISPYGKTREVEYRGEKVYCMMYRTSGAMDELKFEMKMIDIGAVKVPELAK